MPTSQKDKPESRVAAKLLFQFRVVVDGDSGKRRICDERIINFTARAPRDVALQQQIGAICRAAGFDPPTIFTPQ